MLAGGQSAHNRSNSAFSFEQRSTASRGRTGTLLAQINENEKPGEKPDAVHSRTNSDHGSQNSNVSRSNTLRSVNNTGQGSRSNTIKGDVSRSNTVKSTGGGGRARSNTLRSIRFDDERPESLSNESDTTAVDTPDGSKVGQPLKLTK